MAHGYGLETRPEDLAVIGGPIDRETEETGRHRVERQADEGAAEIEQEELDQEGRAPQYFNREDKPKPQPSRPVATRERHGESQHEPARGARGPDQGRDAGGIDHVGEVLRDQSEVERHALPHRVRRSSMAPSPAMPRLMTR